MTSLYIANTSKQHHDFHFRRPESHQTTMIPIKAGQQVCVIKDAGKDDVDFIIDQHRKYGLLPAEEAARRHNGFTGLCYSVDKPVTEKQMRGSFENNDTVLKEQGRKNIGEQAAAVQEKINEELQAQGLDAAVDHMEVEVREETKPGEEASMEPVQVEVAKKGEGRRGGKLKD